MSERAPTEVDQHIAWLRQYVAAMTAGNWKDMQTRLDCQLDKLTAALAAAQRVAGEDADEVQKLGELHAVLVCENEQLRAALQKCVSVFEQFADAGNYPFPLLNNGGWKFAIDALALSPGKVSEAND